MKIVALDGADSTPGEADPRSDPRFAALRFDDPATADTVDDASAVLWHPARSLQRYLMPLDRVTDDGLAVPTPTQSARLLADARRWREHFDALVARGGLLVVALHAPTRIGVHTLQEVVPFDIAEVMPGPTIGLRPLSTASAPSSDIFTAICGAPFRPLLERIASCARISIAADASGGTALATVGQETVALYQYRRPGHLMLIPDSSAPDIELLRLMGPLAAALSASARLPAPRAPTFVSERAITESLQEHREQLAALQRQIATLERHSRPYALARLLLSPDRTLLHQGIESLLRPIASRIEVADGFTSPSVEFSIAAVPMRLTTDDTLLLQRIDTASDDPRPLPAVELSQRTFAALALGADPRTELLALLDPVTRTAMLERLERRIEDEWPPKS